MSRWRQKGVVLDSDDEEEESQIESQNIEQHGRVERVDVAEEGHGETTEAGSRDQKDDHWKQEKRMVLEEVEVVDPDKTSSTPTKRISPKRPTISPFTPVSTRDERRASTESPDPLQSSPTLKSRQSRPPPFSQRRSTPVFPPSSPKLLQNSHVAIPSQTLGSYTELPRPPIAINAERTTNGAELLGKFGIAPLSDDSGDEPLSDPPSDMESPPTAFITPHRRTAVHVIIPSSTALQKHIANERSRRDFRQRKPIQLHPYALEGELYRREVQSRGLKPVPRQQSPQRQPRHDAETQEKDFNPNHSPSSSLPEVEIPVSTPDVQRPRKDAQKGNPVRRPTSDPTRQDPSTQLHLPNAPKRRKLNSPLAKITTVSTSIFDDDTVPRDIWSIPPNSPPYSSSPLLNGIGSARRLDRLRITQHAPDLPTPSTSSVFQDDPQQLLASDSEHAPRSVQRFGGELHHPTTIVLSDSHSSASESSSEPEQSDNELRRVGRKIKGVLPASWLRFDRQTQERRKARERERERARLNATLSPEPTEPQRGVAQRVAKRVGRPRGALGAGTPSRDIVTITDESDEEPRVSTLNRDQRVQDSLEDASALAALFDSRYADDNLSDMENDRLHLPTLGGTNSKRKRQTKVTDAFDKAKKARLSNGAAKAAGRERRLLGGTAVKMKHIGPRLVRRTPPPAMSVIDMELSPSRRNSDIPQFLKIARRQALRRPDLARQSISNKQIRLHNARDTEDANLTIEQWRQGNLKPNGKVRSQRQIVRRSPLAEKDDNQQGAQSLPNDGVYVTKDLDKGSATGTEVLRCRRRQDVPSGLHIFQRISAQSTRSSHHGQKTHSSNRGPRRLVSKGPLPFRAAQLEGDEKEFGRDHKKIAFERGLHRVDQQFGIPLPQDQQRGNPVLARFLADDDAVLPPLPSVQDIGEPPGKSPAKNTHPAGRRLIRKTQAHRVDVDARQYRQPSEPAVEDVFKTMTLQNLEVESEQDQLALQGLGPYTTRYPVTFDVHSLESETYFHSSTFIGSDEFRQALLLGKADGRDLDDPAGYCSIVQDTVSIRCGPWNDQTYSGIQDIMRITWAPLDDQAHAVETVPLLRKEILGQSARWLRSVITYLAEHISFLDSIDRIDFLTKMTSFIKSLFDRLFTVYATVSEQSFTSDAASRSIRVMSYLLVLSVQVHQIAQHQSVELSRRSEVVDTIKSICRIIITHLVRHSVSELSDFLEKNKRHAVRMNGVQEGDAIVESVVICMHVLDSVALPGLGFWTIVSQELSLLMMKATDTQTFESTWATIFTFLPFIEVDISGIPVKDGRFSFQDDDWTGIRDLLKRLFDLYPSTSRKHNGLLNDYVRANLARCHRLIHHWHWRRPEQMLNVVLDFFGKNSLKQLRREASSSSVSFLENLTSEPSLTLLPNENSFHIALKCLALGLEGMKVAYPEKKIRSFVFRTIPNHGRTYPKDQPLDEEALTALRNHHDLLTTLYWAAPPTCRPKLDHIRHLVNHDSSHQEACRLSVRAWANLTTFQLSTEEPYSSAKPFALWHKDIMHQTMKQYRLAKTEADDYLKSGVLDGTTDVSAVMVRQTMEKNQEQVIATLRDCIAGMRKAMHYTKDQTSLKAFVIDSDIVHLLELPHLEDRRLVSVTRDTLMVLREYAKLQKALSSKEVSQQISEESQDYGDFPDLDNWEGIDSRPDDSAIKSLSLDFVQAPLWHLLSNAFGAENSPDENLLMDCVDTWVLIAESQITSGSRSWSYYINSFSQVSWQQLRDTEQTRKFGPYFLAALIDCDPAAYEEHRHDFVTALLLCLADRESMLRFQSRLLHAIARTDQDHPLLKNLPFFRGQHSGDWDITPETVRTRRLALLSSILSNMRDNVEAISHTTSARAAEVRRVYAAMLKDFMTAMKSNYQQLRQGTIVTGAYVEFVQAIVQFLKQYTSDICPVLPFFTDSVAFPLPAADPTYVVGRLCGYAPKATDPGITKQLSVFIQTVAQQAAADNQQSYLVNQLTTALCTSEVPFADRATLRSVLLQGIFPAYLEEAFSSCTAFIIARPTLQSLSSIFDSMIFDLRITQSSSLSSIVGSIVSISHAFVRSTEQLRDNPVLFMQPYILSALTYMLEATISILPLLEYIWTRTMGPICAGKPPLVAYMEQFSVYAAEMIHDMVPRAIPVFEGDAHASPAEKLYADLLAFCKRGLSEALRVNWSESHGAVWFGQGHARREVVFDIGSVEEERTRLVVAIEGFSRTLNVIYGAERCATEERGKVGSDIVI